MAAAESAHEHVEKRPRVLKEGRQEEDEEIIQPICRDPAKSMVIGLDLKADHANRPVYVTNDKHIFLEAFSRFYLPAYEFLVAICEPVARPELFHEYKVTTNSLYGALAIGLTTKAILVTLDRLCKTNLPLMFVKFVEEVTMKYGKSKLVLHRGKYFVEAREDGTLISLLSNPAIAAARVPTDDGRFLTNEQPSDGDSEIIATMLNVGRTIESITTGDGGEVAADLGESICGRGSVSFAIHLEQVETVKKEALGMGFPLIEEYDFHSDVENAKIPMALKPSTRVRDYQTTALRKMFGNGRARSGTIVLPCGAGKTLVGITAATTIGRSCVVLCTSVVAVQQWKDQFLQWTTVSDHNIVCFTSSHKRTPGETQNTKPMILITTYSMMATVKRSDINEDIVCGIRGREWGLVRFLFLVMGFVFVLLAMKFMSSTDVAGRSARCARKHF
jgi:DNA excision repair protein ERCC-3